MPMSRLLTPDDLVREVKHLPSAPRVLPRLKELLSDDNSAMDEIATLIRLDPGIAARVLQTANSAYFSKGVRCFAVDEAVQRVGFGQVYELVSLAVAAQVLVRPLSVYAIEADELWKLSVACALAAELLADRTGQDRNVAYTLGLLHGVGMVAIDEWAARNAPKLSLPTAGFPAEASEAERAAFGFTQAAVGGALLIDWGFPRTISEPVRWQYSPRHATGESRLAVLLHVAKWLRTVACLGKGACAALPQAAELKACGVGASSLPDLALAVERRLREVDSLLETKSRAVVDRTKFPAHRLAS